jgi:2-dehydro-3-deoxyglucarate aldolase
MDFRRLIMQHSNLKTKLKRGELCLGTWITLGHSAIAEIFARAGFDWLVVDLEHSTISIDQAGEMIRAIDLSGSAPLVRLTSNDINLIKRVMDAGAHGIVVPNINTPEEAREAVAATRYAPHGCRGVGLGRAQQYGPGFKDYLEWQKDGPLVIVMIENQIALDRLGEFDRPEFLIAMKRILSAGLKAGCAAGLHIIEPDPARLQQVITEGYRFVAYSVDIRMLDVSARTGISFAKELKK